jgi:SAM-dependent methyltransferase
MVSRYARVDPLAKVLDAGCGTGGNLVFFGGRLPQARLYGVDVHPLAVSLTQMRCPDRVLRASVNALPFRDLVFDVVVSLDVFSARGVDDLEALHESYRVLKVGGVLAVNLPAFEFLRGEHDLAVHTRHRYTAKEIRKKLVTAGFVVRRLTHWNLFLFPVILARRFLSRWGRIPPSPRSDLRPLPSFLNGALKDLVLLEKTVIAWIDLPFGSSVFAVAQKETGSLGSSQRVQVPKHSLRKR